jgi:recombination protein RecT
MNAQESTEAVASAPSQRKSLTVRQRIESPDFRAAVAQVLPKHLTPDRFVRVAILALTRTPALAECEQASLFNALMRLSQLGLEPDGYRAHLIPFRNEKRGVVECQLIIDYKGLAELVMRSGTVSFLHADVVCDNDRFDFDRGEILEHRINLKEDRGSPYAVYCRVKFKDGSERAELMSKADVERIRQRSKTPTKGPWQTDWNEMAKKTCFRRLSKWLPLSAELRDAADADSEALEDQRVAGARPIFDSREAIPAMRADSFLSPLPPPPEETSETRPTAPPAPASEERAVPAHDPERPVVVAGTARASSGANAPESVQQRQCLELAALVTELGYSYDDLRRCAEANTWPVDLGAFGGFADLTEKETRFLLRNREGLKLALKTWKGIKAA